MINEKKGEKKLEEIQRNIAKVKGDLEKKERKVKRGADRACEAKLGAISLLQKIRDCHLLRNNSSKSSFKDKSRTTLDNIHPITIEALGRLCGDEGEALIEFYDDEQKQFSSPDDPELEKILVEEDDKPVVLDRWIRVDSPVEQRDNDVMEFEYVDSKVPDRLDIKQQNKKFMADVLYRREMGKC